MSQTQKQAAIAVVLLLAGVLSGCVVFDNAQATFRETRHLTVPHEVGSGIAVTTTNGSVQILGAPGTQDVQIEATLKCTSQERLEQTKIITDRSGDRLIIDVSWPGGRAQNNESCAFDITVPNGIKLTISPRRH